MPSASSAKLAKISSVPVNATAVKSGVISSVTVADTIVTENATNPGLSTSSSSSNAGAAAVATTADAAAVSSSTNSSSSAATNLASVVENHNANSLTTPIKQTLIIIEHKIRNLEKRKTKLESYRAIQASGKELSGDQKQAVAKYDEVAQCLEFARDLTKQMIQLSNNAEKEQKKVARREAILRAQAETSKIREVLTIQNILSHFADENVREDFLNGENGATKLEENDLNILEKFYIDTNIKRQESPEDVPFMTNVQKAAELFSFTIDGRVKQYGETTFENLRRIFQNIQDCGYFDQAGKVETIDDEEDFGETIANEEQDDEQVINTETGAEQEQGVIDMVSGEMVQMQITQSQQPLAGHVEMAKFEAPSAAAVPAPAFPQSAMLQQQQQQQQQPPTQQIIGAAQIPQPQPGLQRPVMVSPVVPPSAGTVVGGQPPPVAQVPPAGVPAGAANQIHFPPTTVRAVEQGYYKQHQYIHQMRPLAEVIGSTNFYFLQESELDSPDMVASGFAPNEAQAASGVLNPGVLPPQSPNTPGQPIIHQQQPPSQQQQAQPQSQIPMSQAGISQKQQPVSAHNSQTFTNPAFPPNVPPQNNMLPQGTPNPDMAGTPQQHQQQQMPPVYPPQQQPGGPGMPLQSMIPPPQTVVSQQQSQILNSMVDSQSMADVISQQAAANMAILMSGPSGANVPMPGFPPNKFQQAQNPAMIGGHQQSVNQMGNSDGLDQMQQSQQHSNDKQSRDDIKDSRPKNDSEDWDAHEPHVQKSHTSIMTRTDDDSNQWSNDVANSNNSSNKHDWNSNYDSQNDSNTWKNVPNDSYSGRHAGRNNYSGSGNRTGGSGGTGRGGNGGGMRGSNNGGNGGPPSNGYRGRSNNYPQQQGNRNAMYFRNNDNSGGGGGGGGYYQNQNGNTSGGGGYANKDSSGNFTGNSGSGNNYRPRGGPMLSNNRQQSGGRVGGGPPNNNGGGPPQSQSARNGAGSGPNPNPNRSSNMGPGTGGMSSNPNARPGGRNPGSTYGGSRPQQQPNNVRQQQDINA